MTDATDTTHPDEEGPGRGSRRTFLARGAAGAALLPYVAPLIRTFLLDDAHAQSNSPSPLSNEHPPPPPTNAPPANEDRGSSTDHGRNEDEDKGDGKGQDKD